MINVMHSANKPMNQAEKCLDPQLWQACAGGMAQIPPPNSKVYYFPQGHSEHANKNVDFGGGIPPVIPCRVSTIKYLADADSDEVYAKIRLVPLRINDANSHDDDDDDESIFLGSDKSEEKEKTTNSFAKTLTQSDANNGGGFSVPRYCAETIFPRLDYSAEPPVQTILVKDVHGEIWKFRHIYRGTPRRHLLTTGWSNFVNRKKVVAGDSIVFLRAENGDLCVGIRRAKRGIGGGPEVVCGWSNGAMGFSDFLSGNRNVCEKERGNVSGESVVEAVNLAVSGRAFEVVYYPLASTPEFVVRERVVKAAMRVRWCPGMRFKMAFETEDSSRISWFMGTISSVHVDDPVRWPNSPWRLLQVAWDEPDLLQNVRRVSPWLVELVPNMPAGNLPPFSPPRKRPRFPHPSDFSMPVGNLPPFLNNINNPLSPISPLCFLPENFSKGLQGARHARLESHPLDQHFKNQIQPFDFKLLDDDDALSRSNRLDENRSSFDRDHSNNTKPMFRLFGQPILSAEQISRSYSADNNTEGCSSSDANQENTANVSNGSGSGVFQNFPPEASSDET